ncbi:MAG: hypothetical protein GF308_07640 [Candidatus Heimdallarchaeota archaeon]|nr:hypothetical protein [Candidatus Heimdallarchaeota archaeon]
MGMYLNDAPPGHSILMIKEELFVPLKQTTLTGKITLPLADLYLEQEFLFTKKEHDKTIEAIYRFPLPGDAAIKDVEVRFGSRVIKTTLKKRKEAEEEYAEAVEEGKQAAIVSREAPNVFTLKVAGIHPDELVKVKTHYVQILQPSSNGYTFRLPLTTAPRYVRDDELGSRHAEGNPLALVRDPKHRFSMNISIEGIAKVTSQTHEIVQDGRNVIIDSVIPNKDLVLELELERKAKPSLKVITHKEKDYMYFLVLATPPKATEKVKKISFVECIDHSGSMGSPHRDGSKWNISDFVAKMTYLEVKGIATKVHICAFDTNTYWIEVKNQKDLNHFLSQNHGGGGTHLGVAIEQGINKHRKRDDALPYNVIITDAQVSDYGRLFRLADKMRESQQRFVMICIDTAPNAYIPIEMARRAGGLSFFLSSSTEGDMINAVETISKYWKEPLGHVRVKIESSQAENEVEHSQGLHDENYLELGDLLKNMSRWAVGRIKATDKANIKFSLFVDEEKVDQIEIQNKNTNNYIKDIFGVHRVNYLESLITARYNFPYLSRILFLIGYNIDLQGDDDLIYSDNKLQLTRENLDDLLANVALEYGLASKETSFIAVTEQEGKIVESHVVPSALPENWDMPPQASLKFMAAAPTSRRRSRKPLGRLFGGQKMDSARDAIIERGITVDAKPSPKAKETPDVVFEGKTKQGLFYESEEKVTITSIEVKGDVPPGAKLFVFQKGQSVPLVTIDLQRVRLLGKRPLNFTGFVRLECNEEGIKIILR